MKAVTEAPHYKAAQRSFPLRGLPTPKASLVHEGNGCEGEAAAEEELWEEQTEMLIKSSDTLKEGS